MGKPSSCLVLDQGGHASRALVFNDQGEKIFTAEFPVKTIRQGDYVEHDASELLQSLQQTLHKVSTSDVLQQTNLISMGLATQRSNMLCWRRSDNRPLSPVISWQDRRAEDRLKGIDLQKVHSKTGLYANAHYGATKMAWCLEHIAEVQTAARDNDLIVGPMASYLASCLTGSTAFADPVNASRTMLWNIHTSDWDDELCEWFGIDKSYLPGCVYSDHGFGEIAVSGQDIPLSIVTGDLSAATFFNGQPREDIAYITLGTGAFIQRVSNKIHNHPQLLDGIVWSSRYSQYISLEGTVNGAGSAINWLADQHNIDEQQLFSKIQNWCETTSDVPLFFNAVSGIGSPAWCAQESPRFNWQANLQQQAVAVIESIVFLLYLNMQTMNEVITGASRIFISGGLSRVDAICQKLSDLSQLPLQRSNETEGTGKGLAYLLLASEASWNSGFDLFSVKENNQLQQRYQDWLAFMRKQSSEHCLYFQ